MRELPRVRQAFPSINPKSKPTSNSNPNPYPNSNPNPNPNPNRNPNLLISIDKDRSGLMEFDEFVQLCKKLNQEGELRTSAGDAPSKAKAAGAPAAGGDFKKVEKKLSETLAKGLNLPKGAAGLLCGVCTAPRKKSTGEPGRVASPNVEGA